MKRRTTYWILAAAAVVALSCVCLFLMGRHVPELANSPAPMRGHEIADAIRSFEYTGGTKSDTEPDTEPDAKSDAKSDAAHGMRSMEAPEPDMSNIGGITGWLKVAHLAEAHNLPVTTHGVHDLHVHTLAAVSNASYLEAHGFGLEAFLREPLMIEDGWAIAPDRPGHGVRFDWEALAAHRATR